jgi:tight adherence protein B
MTFLLILTFLAIFFVTMCCVGVGLALHESKQRKLFMQMLRTVEAGATAPAKDILRPLEDRNRSREWLQRLPMMGALETTLRQSGLDWSAERLLAMCAGGCLIGAFIGAKLDLLSMTLLSTAVFSLIGTLAPWMYVARKRNKNIKAFEAQFPEALDFLARCLRAGHGFGTGLEMLAAESPDPLGEAIRRVSNELQLGAPMDVAMKGLTDAVPLVDIRFFISAVIIQRETGGNLGEILGRLSGIIRERCKLRGQVKAMSAHGRITGMVLLLIPVAVLAILSVSAPDYFAGLTKDPTGRMLLLGAAGGQVLAYFCIKKIVNIKV